MISQVLAQTPFNYSYLASSATEDVIIADRISVAGARTVTLSVRIHELNLTSGASFDFLLYGVDPSTTDGTVFITSTSLGSTGAITTSSPNLVALSTIISDPSSPFLRVVMRAQGPAGTGTTYGEFSADLVVRGEEEGAGDERAFAQELLKELQIGALRATGTLSEFPDSITPGGLAASWDLPPQPERPGAGMRDQEGSPETQAHRVEGSVRPSRHPVAEHLIERLLESRFLDARNCVEEGVCVASVTGCSLSVQVGGVPRLIVTQYPLGDSTLLRERAAARLRNEFSTLSDVMAPLIGMLSSHTLVFEAVGQYAIADDASLVTIAARCIAAFHRQTRGVVASTAPIPLMLSWNESDTRSIQILRDLGVRTQTTSALCELGSNWRSDVFIHGDARLEKVVPTSDGRVRLVDWGHSGLGDPAWDIAALCLRPTLARALTGAPLCIWWPEVASVLALSTRSYGDVAPTPALVTIIGMLGAWLLRAAAALVTEHPDARRAVVSGCELVEYADTYAAALDGECQP